MRIHEEKRAAGAQFGGLAYSKNTITTTARWQNKDANWLLSGLRSLDGCETIDFLSWMKLTGNVTKVVKIIKLIDSDDSSDDKMPKNWTRRPWLNRVVSLAGDALD
jgi:hypothetical protein